MVILRQRGDSRLASFNKRDFIVMAFGNIVGSGIFLASSLVIAVAGPLAPLAYLLGGLVMMMETAFLIELAIANPVVGSFKVCAQEVFGPWWGFVNGWMFWTSGVLGMASEVTACAVFARLWLPHWPLWVFSLFFAVAITAVNFNDLKGLSKIEFGLAFTKIATLALFVLAGAALAAGLPIGHLPPEHLAPPLPPAHGAGGLLAAMLFIFFAYTGTGIMGIAASETQAAEKTVPTAAAIVTVGVVALYTLSAYLIVSLLPPGRIDPNASPFVQLFGHFRIPYAGDIVNFILLTAALSALNSQVYSASRMLLSLANANQAPPAVKRQNRKGVPVVAVAVSGLVLLAAALLSYILPERVFIYTVSASSFLALVNWLSVSATHYFYRKKLLATAPDRLKYKAPGYPYLSWLCFAAVLITLLSAPLYPDQLPGLYSGCLLLLVIGAAYFALRPR